MSRSERQLGDFYKKRDKTPLGSGTYGCVYLGIKNSNSRQVSIKDSKIDSEAKPIPPAVLRELVFLKEVDYPHIIRLTSNNVFVEHQSQQPTTCSLVYDFGTVDVRKMIAYYNTQGARITPLVAKSILFQLLLALDYLHKRSIAHCDITPSNLLIGAPEDSLPGVVKLIDFGLSRAIENDRDCPRIYGVVTVWYRAPELLLGDKFYTEKIDIWSAGCIFAELLTGKVLFKTAAKGQESNPSDFNSQQIGHVIEILGAIPPDAILPSYEHASKYSETKFQKSGIGIRARVPDATPSGLQLLEGMLDYNPKRRISSSEALRHPYFNEQPIPVMNIAAQIPDTEWRELVNLGKSGPES